MPRPHGTGRNYFIAGAVVLTAAALTAPTPEAEAYELPGSDLSALDWKIRALESLLVHFRRSGNQVFIEGANLSVRNRRLATASVDGTGNVIVGHDETRIDSGETDVEGALTTLGSSLLSVGGTFDPVLVADLDDGGTLVTLAGSGSHNLVLGRNNDYDSFGGIVSGISNSLQAEDAVALGGSFLDVGQAAVGVGGIANETDFGGLALAGRSHVVVGADGAAVAGRASDVATQGGTVVGGRENQAWFGAVALGGEASSVARPESGTLAGSGHGLRTRYGMGYDVGGAVVAGRDHEVLEERAAAVAGDRCTQRGKASATVGGADHQVWAVDGGVIAGGSANNLLLPSDRMVLLGGAATTLGDWTGWQPYW